MARQKISGSMWLDAGVLGELDVDYVVMYSPATPDKWYMSNGDPGYPGDPAELEVLEAKCGVVDLTLLLQDNKDFLNQILEEVEHGSDE